MPGLLAARLLVDDALDLAVDGQRLVAARDEQLEQELGPDRKRSARLDERAAARDVLGVVGEERVEPLVFDLELDRTPRVGASVAIGLRRPRPTIAGSADERVVIGTRARRSRPRWPVRWRLLRIWIALCAIGVPRRSGSGWCRCSACSASSSRSAAALFAAVDGRSMSARARARAAATSARAAPARSTAVAASAGAGTLRALGRRAAVGAGGRRRDRADPGGDRRGARASGSPTCDWWFGDRGVPRAADRRPRALAGARRPRARRASSGRGACVGALARAAAARSSVAIARAVAVLRRAAGVHVQRDPRLLPGQPVRRERPARRAARVVAARAARVGGRRSSRSSRAGSTCRRFRVRPRRRARRGGGSARRRSALAAAAGALDAAPARAARSATRSTPRTSQAALGGRIETAHFVIHYANTPEIEADIALIAADHEFRYAQVVAQLGVAPAGKIRSFYFANREQKARLDRRARRRDGQAVAARDLPRSPRVPARLAAPRDRARGRERVRRSDRSASRRGASLGVPRADQPRARSRGSPSRSTGPAGYDRLTPHEAVRAMQEMGMPPSIDELLSLQFFSVSSARSYTTAGSFLRFLLDTLRRPRSCARSTATAATSRRAYGKPRAAARGRVAHDDRDDRAAAGAVEASRERFRGGSVFAAALPARDRGAPRARGRRVRARRPRRARSTLLRDVCERRARGAALPARARRLPRRRRPPPSAPRRSGCGLAIAPTPSDVTSSLRAEAFERLARVAAARGDLAPRRPR